MHFHGCCSCMKAIQKPVATVIKHGWNKPFKCHSTTFSYLYIMIFHSYKPCQKSMSILHWQPRNFSNFSQRVVRKHSNRIRDQTSQHSTFFPNKTQHLSSYEYFQTWNRTSTVSPAITCFSPTFAPNLQIPLNSSFATLRFVPGFTPK